ncbi:ABC transporter permease [Mesorhizobium sp.]|uniref:ABC transporter permease n=1 Tax=Mesorhizobium sp. TaxID=1871066 RepID=UPI00257CCC1A|nr:ABC transporter permease [Mesorhizobium sp.]
MSINRNTAPYPTIEPVFSRFAVRGSPTSVVRREEVTPPAVNPPVAKPPPPLLGLRRSVAGLVPGHYALVAPAGLFLLAFIVLPFILLAVASMNGPRGWPSAFNYQQIFALVSDPAAGRIFSGPYLQVLGKSLLVSAVTTVNVVVLAYPLAYYIAIYGGRHKTTLITLITIPFWTSYLLRIFSWKLILGYNGILNAALLKLGWVSQPLDFLLYNSIAVAIALTHAWMAFAVLPIFIALERIDRSLLEAASDLGDGPMWRFLRVTLPISMPGVIAAALLVFIPTVGDYVTPALVGGPSGVMIGNMIDTLYGRADDPHLGAAVAMVSLFAIAALIAGLGAAYLVYRAWRIRP